MYDSNRKEDAKRREIKYWRWYKQTRRVRRNSGVEGEKGKVKMTNNGGNKNIVV